MRERDNGVHREIDPGNLRKIVDQNRNLGLIGDGPEKEVLRGRAVHLGLVISRRTDERRDVTHLRYLIADVDGFPDALRPGSGDQDLAWSGVFRYPLEQPDLLFTAKEHTLAGGAANDISAE